MEGLLEEFPPRSLEGSPTSGGAGSRPVGILDGHFPEPWRREAQHGLTHRRMVTWPCIPRENSLARLCGACRKAMAAFGLSMLIHEPDQPRAMACSSAAAPVFQTGNTVNQDGAELAAACRVTGVRASRMCALAYGKASVVGDGATGGGCQAKLIDTLYVEGIR